MSSEVNGSSTPVLGVWIFLVLVLVVVLDVLDPVPSARQIQLPCWRSSRQPSRRPPVAAVAPPPCMGAPGGRLALPRRAAPEAAGPAHVGHPLAGDAGSMPPERQPSGPPPWPSAGVLRRRCDGAGPSGAAGKRRGAAFALPRRLRLSKSVQDPPGPRRGRVRPASLGEAARGRTPRADAGPPRGRGGL